MKENARVKVMNFNGSDIDYKSDYSIEDMVEDLMTTQDFDNYLYDVENSILDILEQLQATNDNVPCKDVIKDFNKVMGKADNLNPFDKTYSKQLKQVDNECMQIIFKLINNKWWAYNIVANLPYVNPYFKVELY